MHIYNHKLLIRLKVYPCLRDKEKEKSNNRQMIREDWSPAPRLAGKYVHECRPFDLLPVSAVSLHTEHSSYNCIL